MFSIKLLIGEKEISRGNKLLDFMYGKRKVSLARVLPKLVKEQFGVEFQEGVFGLTAYGTDENPIQITVNRDTVEFQLYGDEAKDEWLDGIREFIAKNCKGYFIGMKFSGNVEKLTRNDRVASVKMKDKEVYTGRFDNIEDVRIVVI